MNILLSFDDRFVIPTKVMLKSLILNNNCPINIYILYIDLKEDSINSIMDLQDDSRVHIEFKKIEKEAYNSFPTQNHWPLETWIRLFAFKYLDESIERILWIDGDMIINASIEDFYNQDFDNNTFVAIEDMIGGKEHEEHKQIGMPENKIYVNAGLLLFNLSKIRNTSYEKDIFDYVENYKGKLNYLDQDVLNGAFYNTIKAVCSDFYYNYFSCNINNENYRDLINNVKVIHYVSSQKPWLPKIDCEYVCFKLWWKYALKCGDKKLYKLSKKANWWYIFRNTQKFLHGYRRRFIKYLFGDAYTQVKNWLRHN